MYPLLRRGDKLPTVAVVQIMINRKMKEGTYIKVDGMYGPETKQAVYDFQKASKKLRADGVVGKHTWNALVSGQSLEVIDSVDVTNPKDMGSEDAAIRRAGGTPILNFGMCRGVRVVKHEIHARAKAGGTVLLRFHGHGSPGEMGISVGTGAHASSEFGVTYLDSLAQFIASLAWIFPALGSAELHGCRVGAGQNGRRLCRGLAQAWGVPVTAGIRSQYGGGPSTFRFEGPVYTAFPYGGDLKSWAKSLPVPEVHGKSVNRK